ncbi:helix-turn-helix transcriptional regulator [Clostridium sp. 19966]|uniref:helix-turn-helix transcriptional regulator n=1 Tax=Clostridium sp. 19966 TaxID=2768166 RepID=UPI0028DD4672|nr:helix-turn-helix transcriptional regulator [Clostridium sp. 19966]MDT8717817.1 helix-turn-helix transcriptional regulator [Clostridium sp. 19966]
MGLVISKRLKDSRKQKGLTQKQLADNINVALSVIGDIESGRRVASKSTAQKLSEFFQTSVEYWFDEKSTKGYFSRREKYTALDNVIQSLIKNGRIKTPELDEETWSLIKDAIKIELNILLFKDEQD